MAKKKVRLETFFFVFATITKKKSKNGHFPIKKKKNNEKKKENCDRPTGFNSSHPLDRKQTFFFMDSLRHIIENLYLYFSLHIKPVLIIYILISSTWSTQINSTTPRSNTSSRARLTSWTPSLTTWTPCRPGRCNTTGAIFSPSEPSRTWRRPPRT